MRKAMVRQPGAGLMEGRMPLLQGGQEVIQPTNRGCARLFQALEPIIEDLGMVHQQGLVRTVGRIDSKAGIAGVDRAMMAEIVAGIVGRANGTDIEFSQDALGAEEIILQGAVGPQPDGVGRILVQRRVHIEVALQFEVGPVIQRIAQREGNRLCPSEELVVVRCAPGTEPFRNTVGAHRPPLVMIAFQPDFKKIGESPVVGNIGRAKVGVEIEDRFACGITVVQALRSSAMEKKVVVNEIQGAPILCTCSDAVRRGHSL